MAVIQVPPVEATCPNCGSEFMSPVWAHRKYCCKPCYHSHNRGSNHVNWQGGKWVEKSKGYMRVSDLLGGHKAEHKVVAEKALGRPLRSTEVVHHINGNKLDNRPTNLLVCTRKYHTWLHQEMGLRYARETFLT